MLKPSEPNFLPAEDLGPFIVKIGQPVLLIVGALLIFGSSTKLGGVVLGVIVAGLGVLQFHICGLTKANSECVWYRRYRSWERIEYVEIMKCGKSIYPLGLSYLKLRRWIPPLGKLYFVNYNPGASPLEQLQLSREFIDYIRARMGKPPNSIADEPAEGLSKKGE